MPALLEHLIIETGPVVCFQIDPATGALTYVSSNIERILGYAESEVIGREDFWPDRLDFSDSNGQADVIKTLFLTGKVSLDLKVLKADHEILWAQATAILQRDEDGEPIAILGHLVDITDAKMAGEVLQVAFAELEERVQERTTEIAHANVRLECEIKERREMELALRESEERFRQIAENVTEAFFLFSADSLAVLYVNPAAAKVWGRAEASLCGNRQTWIQAILPEDRARVTDAVREQVEHRLPNLELEFCVQRADGVRWVQAWTSLIHEQGSDGGDRLVITARDITRRKHASAALAHLGAVVESSDDAIYSTDLDGAIVSWNRGAQKVFGYTEQEVIGRSVSLLLPRDLDGETDEILARVKAGHSLEHYETCRLRRERGRIDVSLTVSPIRDGTGEVIGASAIARDITEKKRGEEALRDELEKRVQERTAELARATEELRFELQERRLAEAALHVAKNEAERANQAKSEFLSRTSHELRTPLNAIIGFGQLLELDSLKPPQRESVDHILMAARHLLSLINEVLDIARIESGHLTLSLEPVCLRDVLTEACQLLTPEAQQRGIGLVPNLDIGAEIHWIADRQRLKQVLINLLSNAIKYNRPGGRVEVTHLRSGLNHYRLLVTDTGSGIEPAELDQLFAPFQRLQAAHTPIEGTGLGLALSKRLVEAMAGTIGVSSTPGQGSTFWIEFPAAQSPLEAARNFLHDLPDGGPDIPHTRSILYIEDNLSNQRLIERILAKMPKLELRCETLGQRGIAAAFSQPPDLILLDLDLPDVNGIEVLHRLRQHERTRATQVVVISADATPKQIERMLKAGAAGYLTKPLNIKTFLKVISEVFAQ